nr:hypothetical protein CFP56_31779 [Quercus suber]
MIRGHTTVSISLGTEIAARNGSDETTHHGSVSHSLHRNTTDSVRSRHLVAILLSSDCRARIDHGSCQTLTCRQIMSCRGWRNVLIRAQKCAFCGASLRDRCKGVKYLELLRLEYKATGSASLKSLSHKFVFQSSLRFVASHPDENTRYDSPSTFNSSMESKASMRRVLTG